MPPETRVDATITTYRMKYEMKITLKFSVDKNASIPVVYKTQCQLLYCGLCRSNGLVFIRDMFSTFPNYNPNDEDGCASFTTVGALSWVGEGCSVEKNEQPLSL